MDGHRMVITFYVGVTLLGLIAGLYYDSLFALYIGFISCTGIVLLLTAFALLRKLNDIILTFIIKSIAKKFKSYIGEQVSLVGIFLQIKFNRNINAILLLLMTITLYSGLSLIYHYKVHSSVLIICFVLSILTIINIILLAIRIKKGLYGEKEYEIRELIQFILDNSEGHDGGGGDEIKKIFEPQLGPYDGVSVHESPELDGAIRNVF